MTTAIINGTLLRPFDGSLAGTGDTINFASELGDRNITIRQRLELLSQLTQMGRTRFRPDWTTTNTPEHEAFETIITGDGDDFLIG